MKSLLNFSQSKPLTAMTLSTTLTLATSKIFSSLKKTAERLTYFSVFTDIVHHRSRLNTKKARFGGFCMNQTQKERFWPLQMKTYHTSSKYYLRSKRITAKVNGNLPTVPITYTLKDLQDEEISGTFYEQEIQKISESAEPIYRIEKVIKKQKTKTTTKYLVKWLGYPDKFNSWIDEKDLK
jgi:hypothetical protein